MPKLAKYNQFFQIVAEIGKALHHSDNLDDILQIIVTRIAESFKAKGCLLRTLNPGSGELEIKASYGLSSEYLNKGRVAAENGLSEIYDNKPVIIRDVSQDPLVQYPEEVVTEGIVSIIGLPFEIIGNMRMVLRIYFDRPLDLEEEDIRFLEFMAEQSAIAIKNSLLHSRYFETFRKVSSAIHSGHDVKDILDNIVKNVKEVMGARGCIFWIIDNQNKTVQMKVSSGFLEETLAQVSFEALQAVFLSDAGQSVYIRDVHNDPRVPKYRSLGKRRVVSIVGLPVEIVDRFSGVLAVYFSKERKPLPSEMQFLKSLGEQGAIALHKALRYDEQMLQAFRETIEGLALALEAKDICTHGHSLKVATYAKLTAQQMNLDPKEIDTIYHAGLLHDIGKIAMHDELLGNLGNLSSREFEIIKKHPVIGAKILRPLSFLNDVTPIVLYHHERYNGSGYPEGRQGNEIPLGARIMAVSDAFDAMISDRPNNKPISTGKALLNIQDESGKLFDPQVVSAFIKAIEANVAVVAAYRVPKDYFNKYKEELKQIRKKRRAQDNWIHQCIPGF